MRLALALAAILAATASAPAQERWQASFQQGFAVAAVYKRNGPALRLSCDTSGRRPGSGAIALEFRIPKTAPKPPERIEIAFAAAGQTIRLDARAQVSPARDEVTGSERRAGGGRTLVDTRPSATEDVLEASYELDGQPEAARHMTALVAALAKEPREVTMRIPARGLEAKFTTQQAARALRGFEQGCQDALPAADDELQWDWQQGLDRNAEGKLQPTIAASAEGADENGAKLMFRCVGDRIDALLTRAPAGDDGAMSISVEARDGAAAQSLWRGARTADGAWRLEGDPAARLLAALWNGARTSFAATQPRNASVAFAIEGVPLATRKLIEACPTPLLPPKG